jgi:hypothetical protein
MSSSARLKRREARKTVRPPPKITPARTTEEIVDRLFGLCEKIDRRANSSRPLTAEEMRTVAKRIRSYAIRLRDARLQFTTY